MWMVCSSCIGLEGCHLLVTVSFYVDGLLQLYWFVRRPSFSHTVSFYVDGLLQLYWFGRMPSFIHSFILCGWFAPVVLVCKDAIF